MAQELITANSHEVGGILDKNLEDFVSFTVGGQLFGIPILKVQDILSLEAIASIPLAPPRVKGSINLRGRIVTVISVRVCLGLSELSVDNEDNEDVTATNGENEYAPMGVTVEHEHDLYTLLVDNVGDVISTSQECYESNPSTLDPVWREFALGVYRLEGQLMVVLDIERLLGIDKMATAV